MNVYNCAVCTTSLPVLAGELERLFQGNEGPPKFFSEGVYRESIFRILLEQAVFSVSSYPYRPSVCGWSTGRSCPARPSCEQPRCGGRWALSSGIPWFSPALWGLRIVSTHCSSFLLFQGSRVSNETCPLYFYSLPTSSTLRRDEHQDCSGFYSEHLYCYQRGRQRDCDWISSWMSLKLSKCIEPFIRFT